ncbi:MAG: 30S ribosomal protein S9 [Verrucomicrobia bacterium]|jgi:small subunit ribosomal protein S9|nr:MAG: 30S ribosomal protein S9 [Verrucomicrobiota bacterium]MDH4470117.1 30S ribosomal protein S9 [Verrucomicrobiae bacterium]
MLEETPVVKTTKTPVKVGNSGNVTATGRRKTAVATIRLVDGSGKIRVNGREFSDYFTTVSMQNKVLKPFDSVNAIKSYDVIVKTQGGGLNGQAGAVSLAIARALNGIDSELRPILKQNGLLTRDPRRRERNKPGRAGARKRFQFSKR